MKHQQPIDDKFNVSGCFEFFDKGFSINYGSFSKSLLWEEITELIAYKADLLTTDRIEMKIVYGDYFFTLSEELSGWPNFVRKLKEVFPSIPDNWDTSIIFPAFAENRTILFTKLRS